MRVIIVDDDPAELKRLAALLKTEPSIDLAGVFTDARETFNNIETLKPDILLTDIEMPNINGIGLIALAKDRFPALRVLAYTVHEDAETVFEAFKAGAEGYLTKDAAPKDIIGALINLDGGGAPMSPKIARLVANSMRGASAGEESLSHREKEILKNIEMGLSYKQVAEKCLISFHTVHTHVRNIYQKLQAGNKQDAIRKAKEIKMF